jgi:hypothetical protein
MDKEITQAQKIAFTCLCGNSIDSEPADTLMYEEYLEAEDNNPKHEIFIENSAHDPAGYTIKKDCPQCNMDFMTMIILGSNETVIYTCTCGFRITRSDYEANILNK